MHGCAEAGRVGKTVAGWAVLKDAPAASSGFSYRLRTSTAELFKIYLLFIIIIYYFLINFVILKV
jgi:hypothetical protein